MPESPRSSNGDGSLEFALRLVRAGLSVIPIRCDGTKAPALKRWKPYQKQRPDDATIVAWFAKKDRPGIAIICGAISGNLEIIDGDDRATFENFHGAAIQAVPKIANSPLIETPSGGFHLIYRCAGAVAGNQKLAERPLEGGKRETLLETRGEGGYALTVGSPPECHELRKPYRLLKGKFEDIPVLTEEERAALLACAASFSELPTVTGEDQSAESERSPSGTAVSADRERPGDDFNRRASWSETLTPHGWQSMRVSDGVEFWRRPGKNQCGWSATTNYRGNGLLHVFSSNAAPFEEGRSYSKFAALALLEYGGDFRAAARRLAEKGYGVGASHPDATEKSGVRFPFQLNDEGVEYAEERDGGASTDWVRVCSYLKVAAATRSEGGQDWGRLLQLRDADGNCHEWAMPMSLLAGDGVEYREQLLAMGVTIEPGIKPRGRLHQYISSTVPPVRARAVTRLGWQGPAFVLPDVVFGNTQSERILYQTAHPIEHTFKIRGTLDQWQKEVAALCAGNSRLLFSVSCGFAAPLLYLTNSESGGFNFRHSSSIGKTTALRVAGSVWGGSDAPLGYLRQWRATANGLESVAALHSDTLLALDEISQVTAREAGETAYMLANGQGKQRAGRDGSGRPPATWRILFLSSGEISLADKIREDPRVHVTAGQEVRIVDIPADAGAGLGIFEDLHGFGNGQLFADHLIKISGKLYGTPIRAFLDRVVRDTERCVSTVKRHQADFLGKYCPTDSDGQIRRVASRFGLVAAAGDLAIALGVLPWSPGVAEQGAASCFKAWLDERGTTGPAEIAAGIAQVRKFLEMHGDSRFANWEGDTERNWHVINRAGIRKQVSEGAEFFILPEVWRSDVCAGFDAGLIARELKKRGWLIPDRSDDKVQSVHRLPDIGRKRVYHMSAKFLADAPREPGEEG